MPILYYSFYSSSERPDPSVAQCSSYIAVLSRAVLVRACDERAILSYFKEVLFTASQNGLTNANVSFHYRKSKGHFLHVVSILFVIFWTINIRKSDACLWCTKDKKMCHKYASTEYVFINQILNYVYNTYVLSATVSSAPFYIIHYRLFSMSNNNHMTWLSQVYEVDMHMLYTNIWIN